jgi:LmbE family N-acetylglucosaminyl deacetylase
MSHRICDADSVPSVGRDRRQFLAAGLAAAAGLAGGATPAASQPPRQAAADARRTILAIGAHYDDCAFGIPGVLLQAIARGHRVVILSLIGDYSNWKPVRGRGPALASGTTAICAGYGAEARFLPYASGRLAPTEEAKRKVAENVAALMPDDAFILWSRDQHPDHEAASEISKAALHLGDRVLEDPFTEYRAPKRIYFYDNGPRHTIGFVPDTFVDVTPEWPKCLEWLGRLMALTRGEAYQGDTLDGAQRLKESIARYRGATCGVQYAEALASANAYVQALY